MCVCVSPCPLKACRPVNKYRNFGIRHFNGGEREKKRGGCGWFQAAHVGAASLSFRRPARLPFANVGFFSRETNKQTKKNRSTIRNLNALNEAEKPLHTRPLRHTQLGRAGFPGVIFINHIPPGPDLKSGADSKIHFDFHSGAG